MLSKAVTALAFKQKKNSDCLNTEYHRDTLHPRPVLPLSRLFGWCVVLCFLTLDGLDILKQGGGVHSFAANPTGQVTYLCYTSLIHIMTLFHITTLWVTFQLFQAASALILSLHLINDLTRESKREINLLLLFTNLDNLPCFELLSKLGSISSLNHHDVEMILCSRLTLNFTL